MGTYQNIMLSFRENNNNMITRDISGGYTGQSVIRTSTHELGKRGIYRHASKLKQSKKLEK